MVAKLFNCYVNQAWQFTLALRGPSWDFLIMASATGLPPNSASPPIIPESDFSVL
jgi:hypothetical protein